MARYNRLLSVIRTSLVNLDKALQGLQVRVVRELIMKGTHAGRTPGEGLHMASLQGCRM
jgi:hypothetical protein